MYSHLSVSRLRRDKQPVVSVSFGWATDESFVEAPLDSETPGEGLLQEE
jgi:hypothetical protein